MHYKKRKLHKLHSIPIGLCNKEKLYLVSYSIPLSCMVVLLLGFSVMINPDSFAGQKSYAVEMVDGEQSTLANREDDDNGNDDGNDMMRAVARANVNPSLGLTVTNSDQVIETVQGGSTAYSDHLVTITGQELTNYTLSMSSSSSNLTKPSGVSGAEITGAGGVTGDSMTANHWGYAVTEESNSSYGGLTYNTVPTSNTTVASGNTSNGEVASDNTLNVKKKIVIAARFGEDAAPGTYRQTINLSAVANPTTVTFKITYNSNGGGTAPDSATQNSMENSVNFTLAGQGSMSKSGYKFVGWSTSLSATTGSTGTYTVYRTDPQITLYAVWQVIPLGEWSNGTNSGVTNMQDITSGFCKNNGNIPTGSTITLKDSRDTNTYVIYKAADGNCWMGENLRLSGPRTLTSSDSDMSGSWSMPADAASWNTADDSAAHNTVQIKTGSADLSGWKQGYGNYYSWPAATAGSGTTSTSTDAPKSICPKGWKLPAYSDAYSFQTMTDAYKSSWQAGKTINDVSGISGYYLGFDSTSLSKDANFWPAAGILASYDEPIKYAGYYGGYWSRRAKTSSGTSTNAYTLYFGSTLFQPQSSDRRRHGYPVRCVATY